MTASTLSADNSTQFARINFKSGCMKGAYYVHEDFVHFVQQTALCVQGIACCCKG